MLYKNTSLIDIEDEIWGDIPKWEGLYLVSNFGRVKSLKRISIQNKIINDRILKQGITNKGYLFVYLSVDGYKEGLFIHRLVSLSFIPNIENKPCVNHKNGIKHDNRIVNLEWVTYSENNLHSFRELNKIASSKGKFGKDAHRAKKILCVTTGKVFDSRNEAAKEYSICPSNISMVCNKKYSQAKGLNFKYL